VIPLIKKPISALRVNLTFRTKMGIMAYPSTNQAGLLAYGSSYLFRWFKFRPAELTSPSHRALFSTIAKILLKLSGQQWHNEAFVPDHSTGQHAEDSHFLPF